MRRARRVQFLYKALLGAACLHGLIAAIVIGVAPFWPDSFTTSVRAQLPGLVEAFAETPRVEALLEYEAADGYPEESRAGRRLNHAVSDLIIMLSLLPVLIGFTMLLLWGIRDSSYSARIRAIARPEADPIVLVVLAGICGAFAFGLGYMLYLGVMTSESNRPSATFLVFMDLMLLCMLGCSPPYCIVCWCAGTPDASGIELQSGPGLGLAAAHHLQVFDDAAAPRHAVVFFLAVEGELLAGPHHGEDVDRRID